MQYAVYTRETALQIFSFRQILSAADAAAAREKVLRSCQKRPEMVLGVKAFDPATKRCMHGGRWLA